MVVMFFGLHILALILFVGVEASLEMLVFAYKRAVAGVLLRVARPGKGAGVVHAVPGHPLHHLDVGGEGAVASLHAHRLIKEAMVLDGTETKSVSCDVLSVVLRAVVTVLMRVCVLSRRGSRNPAVLFGVVHLGGTVRDAGANPRAVLRLVPQGCFPPVRALWAAVLVTAWRLRLLGPSGAGAAALGPAGVPRLGLGGEVIVGCET